MTRITRAWLTEHEACPDGIAWWEARRERDGAALIRSLMADGQCDWANWAIVRLMRSKRQRVMYAIFAAGQVLPIYEEHHPHDDRPHTAIDAAKAYLARPSAASAAAARSAARSAAGAARSAAYSAKSAAASAESAAWRSMLETILTYGLTLIEQA